ncbi:pulmonary surfactant-associated protein C-like, partial [Meleagris gallopavo]|uniref:pulmonary surfactant-associated protein C-like n=1 Tax=Meleagris gallopavo TaxID=9103 RepID=UPI0012AB9BA9
GRWSSSPRCPPPTQVLRMTIPRDGEGPPQRLSMSPRERTGTFAVKEGLNATAVVVFDYGKLLVSYRSWQRHACFVTRVDEDGIPGLDAISQHFQHREVSAVPKCPRVIVPISHLHPIPIPIP